MKLHKLTLDYPDAVIVNNAKFGWHSIRIQIRVIWMRCHPDFVQPNWHARSLAILWTANELN